MIVDETGHDEGAAENRKASSGPEPEDRGRVFLSGIRADSFGVYASREAGPFAQGLTVSGGIGNGAQGVTASFISQMLYGARSSQTQANVLQTSRDGSGGCLSFESEKGSWQLHRNLKDDEVRVVNQAGDAWDRLLEDITAGVSPSTYALLFTMEADEVRALPDDAPTLNERLLAAGAGTPVSPLGVKDRVERDLAELAGSGASPDENSRIGRLRAAMRQTDERIASLEQANRALEGKRAEMHELEQQIARREETLNAMRVQIGELVDDHDTIESARGHKDELESRSAAIREELEHAVSMVQESAPDEHDRQLVENTGAIEQAAQDAKMLQQVAAREVAISEDLVKTQEMYEQVTLPESETDPQLRHEIEERRGCAFRLATDLEKARGRVKEADRRKSALEAVRGEVPSRRLRARPNIAVVVLGIVCLFVGAAATVFGALSCAGQAADVVSGLVITVAGIIAIAVGIAAAVMGLPRKKDVEDEAKRVDFDERLKEITDEQGEAREALSAAEAAYEENRAQTIAFLAENGFGELGDDLDGALSQVEQRIAHRRLGEYIEELKTEQARLRVHYGRIAQKIQENLKPYNPDITHVEVEGVAEHVEQLSQELRVAQEHQRVYEGNVKQVAALKDRGLRDSQAVRDEERAIAEVTNRHDIEAGDDAAASVSELLEQRRSAARLIEQEQEQATAEHAELAALVASGAHSSMLEEVREYRSELDVRLKRAIERYGELLAAKALMDRAVSEWQSGQLPEVLREASGLVGDISEGKWTAVEMAGGEVRLVSPDGQRDAPDAASADVRQMLYLAFRFAVLLSRPQLGARLPVVLDDVVSLFGESWRPGVERALARLAEARQVILVR